MAGEILWVDPQTLRLPPTRLQGADPTKFQRQLSQYGQSLAGMPPLEVYRTGDGELMIWNGATRAVRAARLRPGELVPVEIIGPSRHRGKRLPLVGDRPP